MTPSPDGSGAGSTGPPDRQTLRLLERQHTSDPLVAETRFDPDVYQPRLLRVLIDTGRYPDPVTAARVDIRWFTTGDFSIHYSEARDSDSSWECRWDRHPNAHNARLHFHHPPTGAEITDLETDSLHPLDVYPTVFEAIEQRIESPW